MPTNRFKTLAIEVNGESQSLPTEFRLFVSGWNETENGRFLFDAEAAKETLAAYKKWGVDLMIDLEHQSLEPDIAPDPTAKDARGWCKLELREDGSLWAVNVKWTEDGAARLREKRQRYVSPAFHVDAKSRRVTAIINVAITAIPATHDTPALVAASADRRSTQTLSSGPAFDDIRCAINVALSELYPQAPGESCSPDGPWVQDVFDASVVFVLKGEFYEAPYTYDGAKATLGAPVKVKRSYVPVDEAPAAATEAAPPAPATNSVPAPTAVVATNSLTAALAAGEQMDPKLIKEALDALIADDAAKCQEILKGLVASAAGAPPEEEAPAEEAPAPDAAAAAAAAPAGEEPPAEDDQAAASAAVSQLTRVTERTSIAAALAEVEVWRASHVKMREQEEKNAADRAAIELNHRKENAKKLQELGAETPFTSGLATFANGAKGALAKRLMDEPLEEQDARIAALLAARGGKLPTSPKPPAPTVTKINAPVAQSFVIDGQTIELTADEIAMCAARKPPLDPAKYAKTRAAMKLRSHNQSNGA